MSSYAYAAMELSQIKYFVVLAQTLHFTKAAEACNVSQPALTRAIQKLEQELGGPLFHRERSHTQLTELGQLMRPSLERALAAAREARQQAEAFRRRETSPLRIGLEYSVPTAVLTPVLSALRRQNTDIELTLRQGSQSLKIFPPLHLVACNPLIRQLESPHLGLAKVA